jgi:hypothetical protein
MQREAKAYLWDIANASTRNNGLRIKLLRPLPVDCWDWTGGLRASGESQSHGGEPSTGSYLGAGAQRPQASVTSRKKQLEHSLFISWINLLSRVCKSLSHPEAEVKAGAQLSQGNRM